jgi:peptidyl-prolyl cis-trans isomerase SurA
MDTVVRAHSQSPEASRVLVMIVGSAHSAQVPGVRTRSNGRIKRCGHFGRTLAAAFAAVLSIGIATPCAAVIVERIVAVVNERPILLSDVRKRVTPLLPAVMGASDEATRIKQVERIYSEALDQLIDESLIQQAARKAQIAVSRLDEDRAIQNVQAQSGIKDEAFWQAVREQGFTESQYREDIRRQLLRYKLLNQHVRGRVNVTEEQVRQRYEDAVRQAQSAQLFHVFHIFFPAASREQLVAAEADAVTLRKLLTPDNFEDQMKSRDGGDLGWLKQGDLPDALDRTIDRMAVNEISQPVLGPSGVHIFFLRAKQKGTTEVPPFDEVKERIYRSLMEQAMARQEKIFLQELRRQAVIDKRLN